MVASHVDLGLQHPEVLGRSHRGGLSGATGARSPAAAPPSPNSRKATPHKGGPCDAKNLTLGMC